MGGPFLKDFIKYLVFLYPKTWCFLVFKVVFFFGVLRFPFGVFGPKLSGHTGEKNFNWQQKQNNNYFKTKKLKRRRLKSNMSKRLWTETRQVGAKNSTQKLSKTIAKLSQAEPSRAESS